MELIRLHKRDQHEIYLPTTGSDEFLDSKRETIYEFKSGKKLAKEEQGKSTIGKKQPFTKAAWKGKTIFKILSLVWWVREPNFCKGQVLCRRPKTR